MLTFIINKYIVYNCLSTTTTTTTKGTNVLLLLLIAATWCDENMRQPVGVAAGQIKVSMPAVRPPRDETYLCKAHRLAPDHEEFIVRFEPHANATKVHHMLVYGCTMPGKFVRDTPDYAWNCGEMGSLTTSGATENDTSRGTSEYEYEYESGPVCGPGQQSIIFSWALDAPSISLPPGVGFKIGGATSNINYLVLQVHYGHTHVFRANAHLVDTSGLVFHTATTGITKLAGIYLLVSMGYVQRGVSRHTMECQFREHKIIHPFRFRTHTHKLGTKVAGFVLPAATSASNNQHQQLMIGEHNPQEPQMFYEVSDKSMTIGHGDTVRAYCDYNNTRDHDVMIGATGNDEMCNFYIMYWTESNELLQQQDCLQYNPSAANADAAADAAADDEDDENNANNMILSST